jgi:hypothetical protein
MYKCDEAAVRAFTRCTVDELGAVGSQGVERGGEIIDAVRDVVKALAAFREETTDRRFGGVRLEKFDPGQAGADEYDIHTLGFDPFAPGGGSPRHFLEKGLCDSDRRDSYSNLVDR